MSKCASGSGGVVASSQGYLLRQVWIAELGGGRPQGLARVAVCDDDHVVYAQNDGRVFRLGPSGQVLWALEHDLDGLTAVACHGDRVLLANADRRIVEVGPSGRRELLAAVDPVASASFVFGLASTRGTIWLAAGTPNGAMLERFRIADGAALGRTPIPVYQASAALSHRGVMTGKILASRAGGVIFAPSSPAQVHRVDDRGAVVSVTPIDVGDFRLAVPDLNGVARVTDTIRQVAELPNGDLLVQVNRRRAVADGGGAEFLVVDPAGAISGRVAERPGGILQGVSPNGTVVLLSAEARDGGRVALIGAVLVGQ